MKKMSLVWALVLALVTVEVSAHTPLRYEDIRDGGELLFVMK